MSGAPRGMSRSGIAASCAPRLDRFAASPGKILVYIRILNPQDFEEHFMSDGNQGPEWWFAWLERPH